MSGPEEYISALHAEARAELVRVDSKIGVLLQAFMVTVSVVVAGAVAGQWNPAMELDGLGEFLWWTGVVLVGLSVAVLILTLNPITTHSDARTDLPRYFGDRKRYSTRDAFRAALETTTDASNRDRLIDQTWELWGLVGDKYRWLHWSSGSYMLGVAVAVVGAVAL